MRELIIGASGLVGSALLRGAKVSGSDVHGTCFQHPSPTLLPLDIRDRASLEGLLTALHPDIVYLPAAIGSAEEVEVHPEESFAVNVQPVKELATLLQKRGTPLVYFSSDYVFDGTSPPYAETAPTSPINAYGRQKVLAEEAIQERLTRFLIIRTAVVYGCEAQGKNFSCRVLQVLRRGEVLKVPRDQKSNPTYAPNLARAVRELALGGACGIFHVAGSAPVLRSDFAFTIARTFGLPMHFISPVDSSELGQKALRPKDVTLDLSKALSTLRTPLMPYFDGLSAMQRDEAALTTHTL